MWLQFTVADVFLLHVTKCHEWLLLVSPASLFSLFLLLMHSDIYILNLPPSNTQFMWWWVAFSRSESFLFAVVLPFSSVLIFCNLQQSELTDHMNVSSGEWGRDEQWESLCWSEEEKNFWALLIHFYSSSGATWLKCRNIALKREFLFVQRDFLSSNHLPVISQNLFFDTGDLQPWSKLAATSSQYVTDPTSMTSFLSQ